jgi:putative endopeptidase
MSPDSFPCGRRQRPRPPGSRQILALETELAKSSLTRVAQRDPAGDRSSTHDDPIAGMTPGISWRSYSRDRLTHRSPGQRIGAGLSAATEPAPGHRPLDQWKAYLRFHVLEATDQWLSTPFVQRILHSARGSPALSSCCRGGNAAPRSRWQLGKRWEKRCGQWPFPPRPGPGPAVIDDIRAAFGDRLNSSPGCRIPPGPRPGQAGPEWEKRSATLTSGGITRSSSSPRGPSY